MRTSDHALPRLLLLAACYVAACANRPDLRVYGVRINSFASPEAPRYRTYFLLPASQKILASDLEFREYGWYVHRALMARGLQPAATLDEAELAVFVDYGVGEPHEHIETYDIPMWGQTGIASTTTTGTISTFGNQSQIRTSTSYTPQYGITGYRTKVETYTLFPRFALFSAVDLRVYRSTRQIVEIWKTQLTSIGVSDDLRTVFPIMVAAAVDLFGVSSGRTIERDLYDNSPQVVWLRTPPSGPAQMAIQPATNQRAIQPAH